MRYHQTRQAHQLVLQVLQVVLLEPLPLVVVVVVVVVVCRPTVACKYPVGI